MNPRNFSLDFLQPSDSSRGSATRLGSSAAPVADEWAEAVRFYGEPVLKALQRGGAKTVLDLFGTTKTELRVPNLQIDQFQGVVWRMIESNQIAVVQQGSTLVDSSVALPIK